MNQLEFSHNDRFLASVSKDRQLAVFRHNGERFELFASDQSHSRIIRSVSFSHDDAFIATGARDKRIKVFRLEESGLSAVEEFTFKEGVSAVAFADKRAKGAYALAVGLENGEVHLLTFSGEKGSLKPQDRVPQHFAHSNYVNRIKYREVAQEGRFQFASCSDDHSVRVFMISYEA